MLNSTCRRNPQSGFTLAEMAIVIVLAGILLTMGLKMTTANLNNGAYAETASKQAQIKLALISFLRTNGRLPCPDNLAAPGLPLGSEPATCNASAAAGSGVVPWVTLQLSKDTVVDGWGNFFTYRVANGVAPTLKNWTTRAVAATTFDVGQLGPPASATGFTIQQGDGVTALATVSTTAVAVIISYGKNSYGARTLQGQLNAVPPALNVDETQNALLGANRFIMRPTTDTGPVGGPFDDRVVYLLPQDLLQPLITEQTISVCRSYCQSCTGNATPFAYCVAAGVPSISPVACTAVKTIPIGNPTPNCP